MNDLIQSKDVSLLNYKPKKQQAILKTVANYVDAMQQNRGRKPETITLSRNDYTDLLNHPEIKEQGAKLTYRGIPIVRS